MTLFRLCLYNSAAAERPAIGSRPAAVGRQGGDADVFGPGLETAPRPHLATGRPRPQ